MNFGPLFWQTFLPGLIGLAMFFISAMLFAVFIVSLRLPYDEWPPVTWVMKFRTSVTVLMVGGAILRFIINNHPWWGLLQVSAYLFAVYAYVPWERRWNVRYWQRSTSA
ncbi:MAG: hypothetical protein HY420_00795 [Candidatus Kerfeldbacteria bacterium]|nr:hypothetical protein [Candidatus Kerfeldbacteria bacterium]